MSKLPEREIRQTIPIINLAIPGSHDSCSYGISQKSHIGPDAEKVVKYLYSIIPCSRFVIRRWAKTQKYSLLEQLNNGIR